MPNTHCLPTGALGTGELPVPHVGDALTAVIEPSPGARRGVVIMLSGAASAIDDPTPTFTDVGGIQPIKWLTLATALKDDGWVCVSVQYAQHLASAPPWQALYNDVTNDAGHGSRFIAQMLRWWDHVVQWVRTNYGPQFPIVVLGFSWGGYHTLHIAANRQADLLAYASHHPATVLSALDPAITVPVDFTAQNTTGLDTTSTMLNTTTKPGAIGWGTADPVVGFTATQAIYDAAHAAGAPVTSNGAATGHTIGTTDVTFYTGWFTSTVDPLAPATL